MSKKRKETLLQVGRRIAKLAVSDWSNPNQPPQKQGSFEIKPEYSTGHQMYAYWDGVAWFGDADSPDGAKEAHADLQVRPNQQVTWRGIVK